MDSSNAAKQQAEGRDNALFGKESGNEGCDDTPVTKPERAEYGRYTPGNNGENTLARVIYCVECRAEVLQEPDDHGAQQDDGERPLQEVLGLVPEKTSDVFRPWHAVVGELHDEGDCIALEGGMVGYDGVQNADDNSDTIEDEHDEPALPREEGRREK